VRSAVAGFTGEIIVIHNDFVSVAGINWSFEVAYPRGRIGPLLPLDCGLADGANNQVTQLSTTIS
jgi:hypothetical protein